MENLVHHPEWHIQETPCYPASFQVLLNDCCPDNTTCNFFRSWKLAQEVDRRNISLKTAWNENVEFFPNVYEPWI